MTLMECVAAWHSSLKLLPSGKVVSTLDAQLTGALMKLPRNQALVEDFEGDLTKLEDVRNALAAVKRSVQNLINNPLPRDVSRGLRSANYNDPKLVAQAAMQSLDQIVRLVEDRIRKVLQLRQDVRAARDKMVAAAEAYFGDKNSTKLAELVSAHKAFVNLCATGGGKGISLSKSQWQDLPPLKADEVLQAREGLKTAVLEVKNARTRFEEANRKLEPLRSEMRGKLNKLASIKF